MLASELILVQVINKICKIKRVAFIGFENGAVISPLHNAVNNAYIPAIGDDHIRSRIGSNFCSNKLRLHASGADTAPRRAFPI